MFLEKIEDAEIKTLWFGNTVVSIHTSSFDSEDGVCVVEHRMPFGEAPPLHIHEREDEIFFCMSGTMLFEVGGDRLTISAGETATAPKGVPHRFRVVSAEGAHCLTITRGADFETMLRTAGRIPTHAGLPTPAAPTPAAIEALTAACAANRIAIMGPPLA